MNDADAKAAIHSLGEKIRAVREIPSGHLYGTVWRQMTLTEYYAAIEVLKGANLVAEQNYLLRWIGPESSAVELPAYRTPGRGENGLGSSRSWKDQ